MGTVRHTTTRAKDVTKVLVRQPGGVVHYNKDGSIEATEKFQCLYTVALAQLPIRYESAHPFFSDLFAQDIALIELPSGMAEITVTYIGGAFGGGVLSGSRLPDPTYELITEAGEVPIETFTNFKTTIGTTANDAVYDPNGLFIGFKPTSQFAGVTGFLSPGAVWRESGFRRTKPTGAELDQVGHINAPTGVQTPPAVSTPRNWLLRAFNYTYEGKIYRYQKEWLLSGRRGWNKTIYA